MALPATENNSAIVMQAKVSEDTMRWPTIGEYIGFIAVIILFAAVTSFLVFATPIGKPVFRKGDCETLNFKKIDKYAFNWNIFLLVISSLLFIGTTAWVEVISALLPTEDDFDDPERQLIDRCIEYGHFCITIANGLLVTVLVSLISSYVSAIPAPNFFQACGNFDQVHLLCSNPSELSRMGIMNHLNPGVQPKSELVDLTCESEANVWEAARSSSPSTSATIQAFLMFCLGFYVQFRMKQPKKTTSFLIHRIIYVKLLIQLVALVFLWGTGVAVVSRKEATWLAVLIGYVIGIIGAVFTTGLTREWLKWLVEKSGLPFRFNDKDLTFHPLTEVVSTQPIDSTTPLSTEQLTTPEMPPTPLPTQQLTTHETPPTPLPTPIIPPRTSLAAEKPTAIPETTPLPKQDKPTPPKTLTPEVKPTPATPSTPILPAHQTTQVSPNVNNNPTTK